MALNNFKFSRLMNKRYNKKPLTLKVSRLVQEYLELQRLRAEVEKAEMEQKSLRNPSQHVGTDEH